MLAVVAFVGGSWLTSHPVVAQNQPVAGEYDVLHYLLMTPPTKEELADLVKTKQSVEWLANRPLITLHGRITTIDTVERRVGGAERVLDIRLLDDSTMIQHQELERILLSLPVRKNIELPPPDSVNKEVFFVIAVLSIAERRKVDVAQGTADLLYESGPRGDAIVFAFSRK